VVNYIFYIFVNINIQHSRNMSQSSNPNQSQQNMSAIVPAGGGGGGAGGGIPDLMKIGTIPVNTVQEVETSILEPVVKSDEFVRFVFQNKGLLHSHSKVEIGLENGTVDAILPLNVGAYGLISRVALKVGNQTLCEIDDFANYYAYRSLFVSNENQKEREQMTTGRCISHSFGYKDRGSVNGGSESDTQSDGLVIDNGRDALIPPGGATPWTNAGFNGAGGLLTGTANYLPRQWQNVKQDVATDRNLYQLSLSELCPFLRHNQLPLYLMKEQVSLELHFTPVGSTALHTGRVSIQKGATNTTAFAIDINKVRLISDHIFYPQELMIQYAKANSVLNFTYADYRLSKYSRSKAELEVQGIRNVGGAGRIVNKIIWGVQNEVKGTGLCNNYSAIAPTVDYASGAASKNDTATFNIKYNDKFEFPIDVVNPARHFHNVNQAEGMVPFVNRQEYCSEGTSLSTRTFDLTSIDSSADAALGLAGSFFWCSQRLTSQERINSRGIELYFKFSGIDAANYTQRVYLEVMRTATLQNGYTECYYA
jgi:hypothetical protein